MIKIIPNASLALGIIFYKERKDMAGNKIRSMHRLKKETFVAYLFVAPALILFLLFVGYPLVASFYLMFCDYNPVSYTHLVPYSLNDDQGIMGCIRIGLDEMKR